MDYQPFDAALAAIEGNETLGMVTFSLAQGTVIGFFVRRAYRRQGIGTTLTQAALDSCRQSGLQKVKVEVCDQRAGDLIESLPAEYRNLLDVVEAFRE